MGDLVRVKYLRPICGWQKGQVRECERYIADSLCADPRPNAAWVATDPLPVETMAIKPEQVETMTVSRRRTPRKRR